MSKQYPSVHFASDKDEISVLRSEVERLRGVIYTNYQDAIAAATSRNEENRRLRDACRSTNRGIARLSKRVQSQAKKIEGWKALMEDALAVLHNYCAAPELREKIDIALHGRRPSENAT